MLHARWGALALGRVNPLIPAAVVLAGLIWLALGHRWIGAGISVGALLALVNGLFLSRRVDAAAVVGDMARALLVMQMGLVISLTIIGVAAVIMVKLSLALAVASVASFAVTHLAILGSFYWTDGRRDVAARSELS